MGILDAPGLTRATANNLYAPARTVDMLAQGAAADGLTNDWTTFTAARTAAGPAGTVHFPARKGATETVYYLGGSRPDLSGTQIAADASVVLKMDTNPNVKTWNLLTPVTINNPVRNTTIRKPASKDLHLAEAMAAAVTFTPKRTVAESFLTGWSLGSWGPTFAIGNSSTWTGNTPAADRLDWASAFASGQQMARTTITYGQSYRVAFESTATAAGGYIFVAALGTDAAQRSAEWRIPIGAGKISRLLDHAGTVELPYSGDTGQAFTLPLKPAGNSFPAGVIVTFRLVTAYQIEIYVNDQLVDQFTAPFAINRVGFGADSVASASIALRRPLRIDTSRPMTQRHVRVSCIGDSQTYGAWSPITWPELLPISLSALPGGGGVTVKENLAVSGTSAQAWASGGAHDVATKNFTDVDYVLVMLGTNNVQGGAGAAVLMTAIMYIADQIVAQGARPIFGLWPQFTSADLTGRGLTTTNYVQNAYYRSPVEAYCAAQGYPIADAHELFGDNPQWFDDNIHPGAVGMAAIAKAFALAIARDNGGEHRETYSKWTPWQGVPSAWFANSWASASGANNGAQFRYNPTDGEVQFRGRITGGTAPSVAINVPDPYRPAWNTGFGARAITSGTEAAGSIAVSTAGGLSVNTGSTGSGATTFTTLDGVRYSTI